ncbi:MAG: Intein-containing protein [Candidatus Yanofskybacteria bacterium GW2011_GWA1_44_21]|uniref:DOD-type homing endonuclease domain-containing protein n=2 Tax=Candidatus Yanofskyibacteriota TaxID=1752733 RepID=A0A1F8H309_9BACT|nr:MAG: Intein-containing protein [Candidatus Yanofskybacteria bacterium GW2011_GWA2_44_10]KKT50904.1 MAG: Intein-containing protein [Candidatus Yanofskybacteria bacterium GW2011_GWA1_44_21]KKT90476.1 MAG: Intein-containing protein [Candidatus Yanofskybacteria bacterium GW2011_GWB1_45_11]OGN18641.1 MAG: hypothetical protein A3F50_00965 [Candidatus Yanofskybacteria bacterium RIFCSPHIGHO2_12_FULL_44_29b]OGN27160.1 MAG: hypothetical protein A3B12_02285 [Candidatus Yanofskybacteria bacterium RIFCSP
MSRQKLPDITFPWTPDLAYATGLIATDGNLSPDGRHMTFKSADRQLVQTFKKCLNLKNKTCKDGILNCYYVQFGNVQFYKWLRTIGIHPAKSLTIGEINIPDKYFRDFLRGHLDGDGSIILYRDKYGLYKKRHYDNLRTYTYFISASERHILWLRNKIIKITGVSGALIRRESKIKNRAIIWQIKIARHESISLLKWLYYSIKIPTLMRKRRTAEKVLRLSKNWKRKNYVFI